VRALDAKVTAVVGSINIAPGSFDERRELAIETRDDGVVDRLHDVARYDWAHSHPMDLSDEGVLADLEDRIEDSAQLLAIDTKRHSTGS
jgi:cardiolipin synthase